MSCSWGPLERGHPPLISRTGIFSHEFMAVSPRRTALQMISLVERKPDSRTVACNLRDVFITLLSAHPVSCSLPPPGQSTWTDHSAPLFLCPRSLWTCDYLCADCQAAVPWSPCSQPLPFPPAERRREEVFSCSCEAALPAWLPESHLLTAGPQEPYSLCWW